MIYLTYITKEEEDKLDNGVDIHITRGDHNFHIHKNNIYCYGEIDLNPDSEDSEQISSFSFLDYLTVGVKTPSDYHYDTHECHSPNPHHRWTETFDPAVLVRYAHAALSKPKRIVLFMKK